MGPGAVLGAGWSSRHRPDLWWADPWPWDGLCRCPVRTERGPPRLPCLMEGSALLSPVHEKQAEN